LGTLLNASTVLIIENRSFLIFDLNHCLNFINLDCNIPELLAIGLKLTKTS
jgi:hypothetical protein